MIAPKENYTLNKFRKSLPVRKRSLYKGATVCGPCYQLFYPCAALSEIKKLNMERSPRKVSCSCQSHSAVCLATTLSSSYEHKGAVSSTP